MHYSCSTLSPYTLLHKLTRPYPRSIPVPAHGSYLQVLYHHAHHNRSCSHHSHRSMAIHLRTSKGYSPYHYRTILPSPSHMFHSQTIPPLQSQGTSNYKTYTFLRCKHSDHQSLPHQSSPSLLHRSDLIYHILFA